MQPIITSNYQPFNVLNIGTVSEPSYLFAFDGLAARKTLSIEFDTQSQDASIVTSMINSLSNGFRLIQVNQATFLLEFRNPVDGIYYNEFTYSSDFGNIRIVIVVFSKPAIWAALSECNILQNVYNNEKFIVKIFQSKFDIYNGQTFNDTLIGEFETMPFVIDGGDLTGRAFQIKLRVDQVIQQIERTPYNDLQEVQQIDKAMMVIPAVWKYSVSNADESEVYNSDLMYSVNCLQQHTWYQALIGSIFPYPNEEGWIGSLRKGACLFTNMGNQYEKSFKDNLTTTFVFENGNEESLMFEVLDQSGNKAIQNTNFNYSLFDAFNTEIRKLPFYFMYFQQNIAEAALPFNDILGKKFSVIAKFDDNNVYPYSDSFICRKFNGVSYYFNNEPFDGFIYEDGLGGFSELPIELKFNGGFEFETKTAILEKPQTIGVGLEQRIFPITNQFNFTQDFEGSTGYFNSVQLPFYRKILASKLILFRRRRIFITSASSKNADEPNGLMFIKFTFKFADNNALYDRNYPTC